ncbi:hypothetical protein [Cytobacillus sp. IB215665]|uniref:hypothetical protein n=1 Tax=Cytobacillus sp. IB215665 TaxID=3097357 RepID=UPI002A176133|nr:hypothetical protein [Cytobacillus sp. IB215665]MDX8364045.1 hypothetical protein [Cytobacillus sp. IB215665]
MMDRLKYNTNLRGFVFFEYNKAAVFAKDNQRAALFYNLDATILDMISPLK